MRWTDCELRGWALTGLSQCTLWTRKHLRMVRGLSSRVMQVRSLGQEDPLEKEMELQYSCLGNPMDRGACQATVHGVAEWDMTEVT